MYANVQVVAQENEIRVKEDGDQIDIFCGNIYISLEKSEALSLCAKIAEILKV